MASSTEMTNPSPPEDDRPSLAVRARTGLQYALAYLPGLLASVVQVALLVLIYRHWTALGSFEVQRMSDSMDRIQAEAQILYGQTTEKVEKAQQQLSVVAADIPKLQTEVENLTVAVFASRIQFDAIAGRIEGSVRKAMKDELDSKIRDWFADLKDDSKNETLIKIKNTTQALDAVKIGVAQLRQEVVRRTRQEDVAVVAFHTEKSLNQQAYSSAYGKLFACYLPVTDKDNQHVALFMGHDGMADRKVAFDRTAYDEDAFRFTAPDRSSESTEEFKPELVFAKGRPKAAHHCILVVSSSAVAPQPNDTKWVNVQVDVVRIAQPPPPNIPPSPAAAVWSDEARVRDGWDRFCSTHQGFVINLTARKGRVDGKPPVQEDPEFLREFISVLYRLVQPPLHRGAKP
jgi:hypothetical protein